MPGFPMPAPGGKGCAHASWPSEARGTDDWAEVRNEGVRIDALEGRQRRRFLPLPFGICRDTPLWILPLAMDMRPMHRSSVH
jgi:hypothetical protein